MSSSAYARSIQLPTRGLLNVNECPDGMLVVDAMTNSHVASMEGASRKNIEVVIDRIISECVVSGWTGSYDNMTMPDRMVLLFGVRTATYGPEYQFTVECPKCEEDSTYVIDIDKLPVTYADDDLEEPFYVELPGCSKTLAWRLLRVKDENAVRIKRKEQAKQGKKDDLSLQFLLARRLVAVDDAAITHIGHALKFVKNLNARDTRLWTKEMECVKLGFMDELEVTCHHCGKDHNLDIPFSTDFFRPELVGKPEESLVHAGDVCISFTGDAHGVLGHHGDAGASDEDADGESSTTSAGTKSDSAIEPTPAAPGSNVIEGSDVGPEAGKTVVNKVNHPAPVFEEE